MRSLAVGLLLATALAPRLPSQQKPTFQTGVELIQVDVRVHDAKRQFVADLRPDDFQILEDGVPQPVKGVFLVRPANTVTLSAGTPRARLDPHVWIFMFDDRHLDPSGLRRARAAVEQFVPSLPAGDFIGVIYRDRMMSARLTTVRKDVLAALRRVRLPGEKPDEAVQMEMGRERQVRNSLETIDALSKQLAGVPGPKTIVLFSDGFPLNNVDGTLRNVVRKTVEAGARIYAVDTRGLAGEPAHTLNSLAVDTDGRVIFNINNLHDALAEVHADTSSYYVLVYESQRTTRDRRFHEITVKVDRRDMKVRARRGYVERRK